MIVFEIFNRLLSFIGKELVEVVRRPGALASLVLGPFLLMVVFGLGYGGTGQPLAAVIVIPEGSDLETDVEFYRQFEREGMEIQGVTTSIEEGRRLLREGLVEIAVIAPPDAEDRFRAGEQSVIRVEYNTVDPISASWASFVGRQLSAEVNREIVRSLVREGQEIAIVEAGRTEVTRIPPEVVAAPTRSEDLNLAPTTPAVVRFFGPAIVALILQHLALTLAALSLVKERTTGAIEIFRISPVSATEVVLGKVFGFGVLVAGVAVITVGVLVSLLGVPMLSGILPIAGVIALMTVASIGIGLVLAALSGSERQAVQLSLLMLLASIFFSGLVLPLDDFSEVVQVIGNALPVTHGMRLLQDFMLTGTTNAVWSIWVLAAIGAISLVSAWLLMRRNMANP